MGEEKGEREEGKTRTRLTTSSKEAGGRGRKRERGRLQTFSGNIKAQGNLASLYEYGQGVAKDTDKAYNLFKEAAEKGDAFSMFNLGNMHYRGKTEGGITFPMDYGIGMSPLSLPRPSLVPPSSLPPLSCPFPELVGPLQLCFLIRGRRKRRTIGSLPRQVRGWYYLPHGLWMALLEGGRRVGVTFHLSPSLFNSNSSALEWYKKSAAKLHAGAQFKLGNIYSSGHGY
jgi:TPR repeat protein